MKNTEDRTKKIDVQIKNALSKRLPWVVVDVDIPVLDYVENTYKHLIEYSVRSSHNTIKFKMLLGG